MAKRDGRIPSGWCITDYHSGCPKTFDHGNCTCSCHRGVKPAVDKASSFTPFDKSKLDYVAVVEPSVTTKKDSTPKRRGRPPGSKNKPKSFNPVVANIAPTERKSSLSSMIKNISA
jgi:hypothetical protein